MRSRFLYVALTVATIALLGCARPLHEAGIASAKPVEIWGGVKNSSQDGGIFFSGQPTADAFRAARADGMKVVVNLRPDREMKSLEFDEETLVKELGMEYVSLPVTPTTFGPADARDLRDVLLNTPGPILIHCASSNRVGAIWAMYLHRHKAIALDDAIELGRKAGLRSEALVKTIRENAD